MATNNANNFFGEVAQKAVIEKDGNVLVVLPTGGSIYDLPGGRLHTSEMPEQGLMREIQEELGVEVKVSHAFFADLWMQSAAAPASARYFVAFACTLADPTVPFVLQEEEVAEVKWIGKDEIDTVPLYDICKKALKAYFAN